MKTIRRVRQMQKTMRDLRARGQSIGFVPTMGYLHEGHLSLLRACRRENDIVVLSIFVNPTQFSPDEDFAAYPRDKKNDCLLAKKVNVDIIFYPSEEEMYPTGYLTYIDVASVSQGLCGSVRPRHFRGVATIVAKLLNIVGPDRIYLGQKDAQQCVVLRRMVQDLNIPTRVRVLPTVRESDGLAKSSRNAYLTPQERREAPVIYSALCRARRQIRDGERDARRIVTGMRDLIAAASSGQIDYVSCVGADDLQPLSRLSGRVLLAVAVRFGAARLIDNMLINVGMREHV